MPKVQVGQIELFYETRGSGAPLVLIPGFGTGQWIWFKQVPALAEHFRVVTFDPRGIGRSHRDGANEAGAEAVDEVASIEMLAGDVAALLDALGIERAHILGASFGGFVAQRFALDYPALTRSLVLSCTSYGGAGHVPPEPATLAALASTKGLNTEERMRENLLLAFSPRYVAEHGDEIEQVIALRAANFVPEHVYLHQLRAAMAFDASARVAEIRAPTLVITGDADIIVPAQNSHHLAARIPRAELRIVAGGSHTFFIEQAAEFNRAVVAFITQAS